LEEDYLSSLVGRAVQIYRGGPDSNNGRLLNVKGDYLALQKDDGEIVYYKTSHIKSVRENSMIKFNSLLNIEDSGNLIKAETFNELAANLKEQTVRINGKGPESKVGKIIEVKEDFILLYTKEDGLIFYKEQHIKSLSFPNKNEDTKEEKETNTTKPEESKKDESPTEETNTEEHDLMQIYGHIMAENMNDVLTNLKYSWVKINRKGPESLEGLLVDSNDNHLVLAVENEILRVSTYHVKNFSVNHKIKQEESNEKNSSEKGSNGKELSEKESNQKEKKGEESNKKQSDENLAHEQRLNEQRINKIIRNRKRRLKNKNKNQQQAKKGK
jgi:spore coat protein B